MTEECRAVYYPNYVARDGVRQYYEGIPDFFQVSGHKYIQRAILEHFTMLSVLSWTSSTNAAHIYHESMARLQGDDKTDPRFCLRTTHTHDGMVLLALLRDIDEHGGVLEVPHTGHQKDWFTKVMEARNDRIHISGQPEYTHWCSRCVRRYDDPDGVTRFVDYIVTDSIDMGRPCCAYPHCAGPLRMTQDHWCPQHQSQKRFCIVEGCRASHRDGYRTCAFHADIEDHHIATGKAMFTLRKRLQRAQVAHPTDTLEPDTPVNEDIEATLAGPCPDKPEEGNYRVRARFGRWRTHNEQLCIHPCGIITSRQTFYTSETVPKVLDMLKAKHSAPSSTPRFVHYDNNCTLFKHCAAKPGEDFHERVGHPVDVFHWTCKHKKSDVECSYHCNPHMFPELIAEGGGRYFNSSWAEQTNVWFGGYHAIIREMGSVKYNFFLDEMILQKNKLTRAKLEADGCIPAYRTDLRFATM
ncbi:hypothetical protein TRAPUB_3516 [Trametes pubescens]|uniref:CxC6 like cysteine cluster associated with KDZ domain-containing protein n=1 Tax=Trametes pubescens TaxID=154538 RepID=A0A1M2VDP2_TRAPU|nr:hypothetical protein TRAPUB_3516 [Trametes pubescens]